MVTGAKFAWGHALDFVRAQWLMLQQDEPEDLVIATGIQHSVRQLCIKSFAFIGIDLEWQGKGIDEVGIIRHVKPTPVLEKYLKKLSINLPSPGTRVISIDPGYFRPTEVDTLLGDASRAREKLGWEPEITFDQMISEMMNRDVLEAARETLCAQNGFVRPESCESMM
ncbi:GDP-mannose 4,6-dehydratase [Desulfonatronovibrio magnus]|uniref:GDP-mannose 4,6-dehydratase n=1 Tax=Desulfonatronovibrio magnus TaxID=698827 RepID=UPI000695CC0A|nr:GDP-mannose 4,6-dehydratase [Desulfonatronovibrio magnus]